jgi:hypothetical protein
MSVAVKFFKLTHPCMRSFLPTIPPAQLQRYPESVRSLVKLLFFLALTSVGAFAQAPAPIQKYLERPGFYWNCEDQPDFHFCWEATLQGDQFLAAAIRSAAPGRKAILTFAQIPQYRHTIHVFFLKTPERMQALIGFHGEGRSRPAEHAVFFVPTMVRPNLTHELTHEILSNAWGAAEAWIEEGYATYLAQRGAVHATCIAMFLRKAMLPLKDLVNESWNPSIYSPDITYMELAGFVEFLEKAYGLDKLRQVWKQGAASIEAITGKSIPALEAEWHKQLDQEISARGIPRLP